MSRSSAVGIATGYGLDGREVWVRVPVGSRMLALHIFQADSGIHPTSPTEWVPGVLSPVVKRPEREADQSPPTSAEMNKTWICTSTPPHAFMA
jgi:hypothetical protein